MRVAGCEFCCPGSPTVVDRARFLELSRVFGPGGFRPPIPPPSHRVLITDHVDPDQIAKRYYSERWAVSLTDR